MSEPRVLVSGASVAGPALAYWLVRAGCKVIVVERAPSLRSAGQGIDVRDAARDVVKRMGIFDRIRDRSSHEEGMEYVDSNNDCYARFGVDKSGKGNSMTSDIEILRESLRGFSLISRRTASPISSAIWSRVWKKQTRKSTYSFSMGPRLQLSTW